MMGVIQRARNPKITRALNIAGALLVPFAIQGVFVIGAMWLRPVQLPVAVELAMFVVSAVAGSLFLLRGHASFGIGMAVAYLLVMLLGLYCFSAFLIGAIYGGDSI